MAAAGTTDKPRKNEMAEKDTKLDEIRDILEDFNPEFDDPLEALQDIAEIMGVTGNLAPADEDDDDGNWGDDDDDEDEESTTRRA